jgi:hypothetical protein
MERILESMPVVSSVSHIVACSYILFLVRSPFFTAPRAIVSTRPKTSLLLQRGRESQSKIGGLYHLSYIAQYHYLGDLWSNRAARFLSNLEIALYEESKMMYMRF